MRGVEQDLVAGGGLDVAATRVESRLALVLSLLQQRQDLASDVVPEAGDGRAVGRVRVGGVGGREKGAGEAHIIK